MSESSDAYDLIIIGGGPAGVVGATTATAAKKKTAVIDCCHELGGAGLNTGTIPSKIPRKTALALLGLRSRDLYGVDLFLWREVTIRDFLGHERQVKAVFNANFLRLLLRSMPDRAF